MVLVADIPRKIQQDRHAPALQRVGDPSQLRHEWLALQRRSGTAFQTYEWFTAWCETAGRAAGQEPAVVASRWPDGSLRAILPLVAGRGMIGRELTTPGRLHAAYHRPLFAKAGDATALFGPERGGAWHLFGDIDCISIDGRLATELGPADPLGGLRHTPVAYSTHSMELDSDWSALYASRFNSRSRSTHRRKLKRLESLGQVRFVIPTTPAARQGQLHEILAQKGADLRARGKADPCAAPGATDFYDRLIAKSRAGDGPELVTAGLYLDGELQAGQVGMIHRRTFHSLILSLGDSVARPLSPGFLLTLRLIEHCCALRLGRYDFGAGDQRYKLELADRSHPLVHGTAWLTASGFAPATLELLRHRAKATLLRSVRPGHWPRSR